VRAAAGVEDWGRGEEGVGVVGGVLLSTMPGARCVRVSRRAARGVGVYVYV